MGRRHVRVLASLPERFELVGAYDPRADVPWPPALPRLESEAEAMARAEVVVVATPTHAHAGTLVRALSAGRHVLVEKPLCATFAEANALASAFARGGMQALRRSLGAIQPRGPRAGPASAARTHRRHRFAQRVGPSQAYRLRRSREPGRSRLRSGGVPGPREPALCARLWAAATLPMCCSIRPPVQSGTCTSTAAAPAKRRAITIRTLALVYEGDLLCPGSCAPRPGRAARSPFLSKSRSLAQAVALADALDGAAPREHRDRRRRRTRGRTRRARPLRSVRLAAEKLSLFARP